jgi:type 1 glutamine amidotransferase
MRSLRLLLILLLAGVSAGCNRPTGTGGPPLRLLLLSGSGNHEWQATTAFLKDMYERSGLFEVRVVLHPDSLDYHLLSRCDVLVNNRNIWPEKACDWSEKAFSGLMRFVEAGGGFVTIHAAGAYCYDRPEFQRLSLATWGDSTWHGEIGPHRVLIHHPDHPVTAGMAPFWTVDELWVDAGITEDAEVLCVANPDAPTPVVLAAMQGKGRLFCNLLGHDVRAMRNSGWQALTVRGTEWAARGAVSTALPPALRAAQEEDADRCTWVESDSSIALHQGGRVLWQFNHRGISGKPFFHPLALTDGTILSALHPADHPWHLGLWHSWKFINGVNYWEYKPEAPWDYAGETVVTLFSAATNPDFSAELNLEIDYRPEGGATLLREQRNIQISSPDADGEYFLDFDQHFEAIEETVLDRTPLPGEPEGKSWGGYAGLSMRFSQDLFDPRFINSDGSSSKAHGDTGPWKYYGLKSIQGRPCGIAIFDHPGNPRHPARWFVEDSPADPFYYFGPAPLFEAPIRLAPGQSLRFRYRVLVLPGEMSYDELQAYWNAYSDEPQ